MARQVDVRYIRLYTDGTAARKLETARPAAKTTLPKKAKKQKKIVIHIDPVAVLGIITAVVMLVIMTASMFMLQDAQNRATVMEQKANALREENQALLAEYEAGYDLEEVERTALALGMVPSNQVQHIHLDVQIPQTPKEATTWDQITAFLAGLFA